MKDPKDVCELHGGYNEGIHRCKFFEIGMGRTASRSVCLAAREMGLVAKHGFNGCSECQKDAMKKTMYGNADYDLYKTCDWSGDVASIHWRLVMNHFPESKFILLTRDVEQWLDATERTRRDKQFARLAYKHPIEHKYLGRVIFCRQVEYNRQVWKDAFLRYIAEVVDAISMSRLLVLNVFDSDQDALWERLASFVGKTAPTGIPFPQKRRRVSYLSPSEKDHK